MLRAKYGGLEDEKDDLMKADGACRLGQVMPLTIDEIEALRA